MTDNTAHSTAHNGANGTVSNAVSINAALRAQAIAAIEAALADAEAAFERPGDGHFVVTLPGTHKLSTTCSLLVGDHTLSVNAFVVRAADENREAVYRWLLEHNTRLSGIAYALDRLGDVFLVGRVPLAAVTETEVDRLLGSVLEAADSSFDTLLELGFASSIRREWEWRLKRGESTANLAAFERLRPAAVPSDGTDGTESTDSTDATDRAEPGSR